MQYKNFIWPGISNIILYIFFSFVIIAYPAYSQLGFSNASLPNLSVMQLQQPDFDVLNISETESYPFHRLFLSNAIRLYQRLISPSRGTSCPMYPHCSSYGYQTFQKYHPLVAFLMTADRLHRCGHDIKNYPTIDLNGHVRFYDPIGVPISSKFPDSISLIERWQFLSLSEEAKSNDYRSRIQNTQIPTQDSLIFEFAKNFQLAGDFERAITEYKRLISYYPQSPLYRDAAVELLNCYYNAGHYLDAIHLAQDIEQNNNLFDLKCQLRLTMGECFFHLENYKRAREYFGLLNDSMCKDSQSTAVLLTGLSYGREYNWSKARQLFETIDDESTSFNKAIRLREICLHGEKMGKKSPTIAGFLSIVPGLGYFYDGYKQTAFASLIVNGLFFWGAYESFERGNDGLGALMSILSFGWYAGNIYGSIVSATRMNNTNNNNLVIQMEYIYDF